MDLFQRLIYGGSNVSAKPIIGNIKNELRYTGSFIGYLGNNNKTYKAFIDLREAKALDGASIVAKEYWLNGAYLSTTYSNELYDFHSLYPGVNKIKARVKDSNGLWSDFSNEIIYDIRPSDNLANPIFVDVNHLSDIFDGHVRLPSDYMDINELIFATMLQQPTPDNQNEDARIYITLWGNDATPIDIVINPNDYSGINGEYLTPGKPSASIWNDTGVIGLRVIKQNCVPGTVLKMEFGGNKGYPPQLFNTEFTV